MQNGNDMLLKKAQKGDPEAFNRLMETHERQIYALSLRMMGNSEDAKDCMQEAMIRIYRSIASFKGESAFSTWIYRITTNTCLDELRRRKNRAGTSLDSLLDDGWSPADPSEAPEESVLRHERQNALKNAIVSLPADMRAVIVMRDVEGHSYEEIADILDVNIGTIKSRISRGREKLKSIILQQRELFVGKSVK